ncbi:hypothetical protein PISMIDRAFT_19654 [Pisolithus microcarpus 441]|uniref:Uncharacterized protein n=1 Tax=Pisolithus microcarpus 441 TaxID=765257 RepID=A0A0C9YTR8_9AGAM|nr:hypothetical protein BKA83DRAFT_19654 [Pisolithus microcarpus]KIK11288.1 hypothetical protein PISMIDRAFT_19654 [Pisolithus microcarpus 441]
MAAKFDAEELTLRQPAEPLVGELGIGELPQASRIGRVRMHVYGRASHGRHCPRPRNQSPNTTATQKIRTDGDLWLRFGKQYETVHIETIKAIKHTSEPGIRAHA